MTDKTPPIPPVSPYLTVNDASAAIEFYQRAFSAVEVARQATPDGNKLVHAAITINGGMIMLSDDFPEFSGGRASTPEAFEGSPVMIHLNLPDVDAVWQQALDAGATVTMPLEDAFWGDRYGQLTDPFGHRWSLATPKTTPSEDQIHAAMKQAFGTPG